MTTFIELKAAQNEAMIKLTEAGQALDKLPKNAMGLITDEAKRSDEFKIAYARRNVVMAEVQKIGRQIAKNFKKENSLYIQEQRLNKLNKT